jgi:deazaflavin-dependent oxidoreductase (nitroreductase family)
VIRHTGRRTGQTYQTPVTVAHHDDYFVIALPYGDRTDWMKNVVHAGHATIVNDGHVFEVERPEVIPMTQATKYFGRNEQRMHRQFHVDNALQVHERAT